MSKYKGLFTFDEDNHRYVPIAQADGIIDTMDYEPDSKPAEPIFDDEKVSKAIRAWLSIQVQPIEAVSILCSKDSDGFFSYHLYGYIANARIVDGKAVVNKNLLAINFDFRSDTFFEHERGHDYTIAELCGEEEE